MDGLMSEHAEDQGAHVLVMATTNTHAGGAQGLQGCLGWIVLVAGIQSTTAERSVGTTEPVIAKQSHTRVITWLTTSVVYFRAFHVLTE